MLWVGLVVAACGWAAWRAERRWVASDDTLTAILAATVIGLSLVAAIGQVLGALGWLRGWTVLAAAIGVATVARFACGTGVPSAEGAAASSPSSHRPFTLAVLVAAVATVAAQWTAHLGDAYSRGMVHADNLWYHGPFAARIVQTGGLGSLAPFGYSESRYFPLNTHVLDAMLILPTGSDVFVPTVNHGAAVLAVFGAWVLGRRRGAAALAAMAVVVVLSLPLVASTQAGQMYNDVVAVAFLIAGVALLAAAAGPAAQDRLGAMRGPPTCVAFLAFGWALSTKLSVAVPVAVLVVGVLVALGRAGRWSAAVASSLAFVATGAVWFVRNLILSGSPMPYADLTVGSVGFEQEVPTIGTTLWSTLGRLGEWGTYYRDSIDVSFGPLWMVVVVAAIAGPIVALVRERGVMRLASVAALAGLVVFSFMPATGELPFVNNLRYGIPALGLGLVVGAIVVARHPRGSLVAMVLAAAVVAADLASPHRGRVRAWPDEVGWAIVGGVVAAAVVTAGLWWPPLARRVPRLGAVTVGLTAIVLVVAAFRLPDAERAYLDGRYDDPVLEDAALYAAVPDDARSRVDVLNSNETYPFFGPRLDNEVVLWNEEVATLGGDACAIVRGWMAEPLDADVDAGHIVAGAGWLLRPISPEERRAWFEADPSVTVVFDDGAEAVYVRTGPLDPSACAPPG